MCRPGLRPRPTLTLPAGSRRSCSSARACQHRFTDRAIDPARDIDPIVAAMESWMPGATRRFLDAKPCPYTLTPDGHFVVDRHPRYERVIICGGFSGHGFKFAPVIGEIAADLALEGVTRHEIEFLSHRRFARGIAPH